MIILTTGCKVGGEVLNYGTRLNNDATIADLDTKTRTKLENMVSQIGLNGELNLKFRYYTKLSYKQLVMQQIQITLI